jgi:hypothetical protein
MAIVAACQEQRSAATPSDAALFDDAREAAPVDNHEDTVLADHGDDGAPADHFREGGNDADADTMPPIALFNGADFSGWEKYLGPPHGSTEPLGASDPKGVFSVVVIDNAAAIRISGEVWGALTTREEFENYHLVLEFKWGSGPVWPPLTARDSGLLYHSVGSFGAVKEGGGKVADPPGSGWFMTSMELQIAENDLGSYYSLGNIVVNGMDYSARASGQYESAVGAWNTVELFVFGNDSVHVINGRRVVSAKGAMHFHNDDGRPLGRGKIQLQSESMEIFFRAITLAPIRAIPPDLL